MARFIALMSGKGGTGKSTVSASLALSLVTLGHRVLAVDLDTGLRSLDILLGVENKVIFDIGDLLAGRCTLSQALTGPENVPGCRLLCSSGESPKQGGEETKICNLLREAGRDFDYVLLDLPAGLGRSIRLARPLADLVGAVATPDVITMRDTHKTMDILLEKHPVPCRLIVNKVGRDTMRAGGLRDLDEMLDTVGIPLFSVIPFDPYIAVPGRQNALTRRVFHAMALRVTGKYAPILMRSV